MRTLQRRVRDWRAQHGPDREAYFEQTAVPGREGALDFTDASDLGVTIQGDAFSHLLFEWVLSFSGWTYVALAASETFEALVAGQSWGGVVTRAYFDQYAQEVAGFVFLDAVNPGRTREERAKGLPPEEREKALAPPTGPHNTAGHASGAPGRVRAGLVRNGQRLF